MGLLGTGLLGTGLLGTGLLGTGLLGSVVIGGCSSDDEPSESDASSADDSEATADGERPLTLAEADLLAACLFKNYDVGGATFELSATFTISGDTLALAGSIDWKQHIGSATVTATGAEAGVTGVFWAEQEVLESRVGLDRVLSDAGFPAGQWVSRRPDPTGRQIDGLLGLVLGLASEQRDNPQLVQQTETALFVRTDTVRDQPVSVMRYDGSEFWLDATGTILRYNATTSDGNRPVTIDFLTLAVQEVSPPQANTVIPYENVSVAYDALMLAPG